MSNGSLRVCNVGTYPPIGGASVLDHISHAGTAVLDDLTPERFMEVCASIGDVLAVSDIRIQADSSKYIYSPGAVPPHSDGSRADVIGWYCVHQDDEDGASILSDTGPLLRGLSSDVRAELATVQLLDLSVGRDCYAPLLQGHDEESWRVNYTPLLRGHFNARQRAAIAAFQSALVSSQPTRIRLRPGQGLFVNNWRILHARDAIKPDSARLLTRSYVRTSRASEIFSTE